MPLCAKLHSSVLRKVLRILLCLSFWKSFQNKDMYVSNILDFPCLSLIVYGPGTSCPLSKSTQDNSLSISFSLLKI